MTNQIALFCLSIFSTFPRFRSPEPIYGHRDNLILVLASTIRDILGLRSSSDTVPRTQFYVFSFGEQIALQSHLIENALASTSTNLGAGSDIRLCIGALSEGASLLSTSFQPLILSGALLDFLTRKGRLSKVELIACLQRLDLPTGGSTEQLLARIQEEIQRLKSEGGRPVMTDTDDQDRRAELGQLPRIVVVKKEVERLLAFPLPGYWDLPECASVLIPVDPHCPSDDDILVHYRNGIDVQVITALQKRNWCVHQVIRHLRARVSGTPGLLVNEARVLSSNFMDICRQESLRKLFFMQQVLSISLHSDYILY